MDDEIKTIEDYIHKINFYYDVFANKSKRSNGEPDIDWDESTNIGNPDHDPKERQYINARIATLFSPHLETVFRGQSDKYYDLVPSIGRKTKNGKSLLYHERHFIEAMKHTLPDVFVETLNPLDLLGLLQHHGVPTRLLDVTTNALVALFFACNSNPDRDGTVYCFCVPAVENDVFSASIISRTYQFTATNTQTTSDDFYFFLESNFPKELERERDAFCKFFELTKLSSGTDFELFKRLLVEILYPWKLPVASSFRAKRQLAQSGKYLLFPNDVRITEDKAYICNQMSFIYSSYHSSIVGIDIPAKVKQPLLDSLDRFGVNKATLFPDSIDSVCETIVNRIVREDYILSD